MNNVQEMTCRELCDLVIGHGRLTDVVRFEVAHELAVRLDEAYEILKLADQTHQPAVGGFLDEYGG